MDLEQRLETIYKNRLEVKYNNAMVREQLWVAGILLLISAFALMAATVLQGAVNELSAITGWSKASITIVVTLVIQVIVMRRMFQFYKVQSGDTTMDKKIDWKDIGKSGLQVMSYAIAMVIAWLLLALTTILIVIDYVNDFQYLGLGIFMALLVEAIATWIVALVLTIKLDNIMKL